MASEMNSVSNTLHAALINDFKSFFRKPDLAGLDTLERIYTQDVEFHDPLHALHGRLAVKNYLRGLYAGTPDIRFNYLEEQIGENSATIVWNMGFCHPRLSGGKPLQLRGVTLIRFTEKIYYQEDFYDLGAMLYQHIPVLGTAVRFVNNRLTA